MDHRTVFIVGRQAGGGAEPGQQILQAAIGFADAEHQKIDLDAVAVTVDLSATERVGAIGEKSLDRLGGTPPAPGTIESAVRRGSRITVRAEAEHLTMDNTGTGQTAGELTVDTRCTAPES
jgi:flagella basal body P-ring formation protein FlgA